MELLKKIVGTNLISANRTIFFLVVLCILFTSISPGFALALGLLYTSILGNPWAAYSKKAVSLVLGLAIVGLGALMDLGAVAEVGIRGIGYTFFGIAITIFLALLFGRILKLDKNLTVLMGVGTAICGGSAIAAASGAIRAKSEEISVAMATVFILNAIALYAFPLIGHLLDLSQTQFGLWSALAIHDTSSVVGAAMKYGEEALNVGTTVKLARALWIAPVTIILAHIWPSSGEKKQSLIIIPWFIIGFVAFAAISSYAPGLSQVAGFIGSGAKRLLVVALFLVGANISLASIKSVGLRAFSLGIVLWVLVSMGTLLAIYANLIKL